MRLPPELRETIEKEIGSFERSALAVASSELTRRYKSSGGAAVQIKKPAMRAAYLAVRFPATFAAVGRVLEEISRLAPQIQIKSLLDLGAGPGTALRAVAEAYPDLERATLVEADAQWIQIGRKLADQSSNSAVRDAEWVRQDLSSAFDLPPHDLVVISYTLGELPPVARTPLLERALAAAQKFLVVIEPGTVRGFGVIHEARTMVIAYGRGILAPCPHRSSCPLAVAGDWCHFSQRVERSSLHRQIKAAELGYEDEKFSYIVAGKNATETGGGRIVRHPQKHTGHVQLTLCTAQRIERPTISRSAKDGYRRARRAEWGDLWTG